MDIEFASSKLQKVLEDEKKLQRNYGERAKPIKLRLALLMQAECLADVPHTPPPRRHMLSEDRQGQFAVDLKHPWRLIFEPADEPLPLLDDGSIDLSRVTKVRIIEITDYH